jgi:hypothetical protein
MGIFDKVEKDAEDLARNDPKLAQQAGQLGGGQLGGGQLGQDMKAAQNMIGKQRGAQDQAGNDQAGNDQAGYDQAEDPSMASGDPGQGQDQDQN